MKGDFTRSTFKPEKHYSSVRMQQGRVQLDADWNEQVDIVNHRMESGTADVFGISGAPKDDPGFEITNDLKITKGRFYVNGILCFNEEEILLTKQKDFPGFELPRQEGYYLAYLDVWQRHLTALDDPSLKEEALRGADTTTRTKTVWQVKLIGPQASKPNCASQFSAYDSLVKPSSSRLRARIYTIPEAALDLCSPVSSSRFAGTQNQLYRVEIHESYKAGSRGTFKWSRDNGIVVAAVLEINAQASREDESTEDILDAGPTAEHNTIVLREPPRDEVYSFAANQWVELISAARELRGEPGTLVRLTNVEGNKLTFDPSTASGKIPNVSPGGEDQDRWKVRRWDHVSETSSIPITGAVEHELEHDIKITFLDGLYRTGDYWLIPARSISGTIEWPVDEQTKEPLALEPFGIKHHYARLAILHRNNVGDWSVVSDCRKVVTPLADQINLFYLGGDGQEGYPGEILPQSLQVGVTSGILPKARARVRFEILHKGGGAFYKDQEGEVIFPQLAGSVVETDVQGIAKCFWKLGSTAADQSVRATLLDEEDHVLHAPITFSAKLNLALSYRGGDGQYGFPEEVLPQPLIVGVTRGLKPVADQAVNFVVAGEGKLYSDSAGTQEVQQPLRTDANGLVQCYWKLGKTAPLQTVTATLWNEKNEPLHVPIHFSAKLDLALSYRSGDGQEGFPEEVLPQPLIVGVTRGLKPVADQSVNFVVAGEGKLYSDSAGTQEVQQPLHTDANGLVQCYWKLGKTAPLQTVTATLWNEKNEPLHVPISFSAKLNLALSYRGGDGQEGYPEELLPQPLLVGVTRGMDKVPNQIVKFALASEQGGILFKEVDGQKVPVGEDGKIFTDADGYAKCWWQLGKTAPHQTVTATLWNEEAVEQKDKTRHVPITFSAKLDLALSYCGGDGQEGYPEELLPQPLLVGVTRGLKPVADHTVNFVVAGEGKLYTDSAGTIEAQQPLRTDANGLVHCYWKVGKTAPLQTVTATLWNEKNEPLHAPITFGARLNLASSIHYDPAPDCKTEAPTVRALFESGDTKVENWPDLDEDRRTSVKDILDGLLCHLTAARLPFLHKEDETGEAKFPEDVAQTVSAALNFLSKRLVPAGMIMAFANETAPEGWLECNGDFKEPAAFPDLFDAIGYKHGRNNDKFKVPDLRGEFVRGWDGGELGSRDRDPDRDKREDIDRNIVGNHVGTYQKDQIQKHKHNDGGHFHNLEAHSHTIEKKNFHSHATAVRVDANAEGASANVLPETSPIATDDVSTSDVGLKSQLGHANLDEPVKINENEDDVNSGSETRPRNVALMYCIKT